MLNILVALLLYINEPLYMAPGKISTPKYSGLYSPRVLETESLLIALTISNKKAGPLCLVIYDGLGIPALWKSDGDLA